MLPATCEVMVIGRGLDAHLQVEGQQAQMAIFQ